jgi:hypothetical protein
MPHIHLSVPGGLQHAILSLSSLRITVRAHLTMRRLVFDLVCLVVAAAVPF